jgi:hypothetical protein
MRPIRWLHISDIQCASAKSGSQDVVLKAMCDDIAKQRNEGATPDFHDNAALTDPKRSLPKPTTNGPRPGPRIVVTRK